MQTYHIETVVSKEGILTIEGLPRHQPYFNFHKGAKPGWNGPLRD
jgi:hypothetical protein